MSDVLPLRAKPSQRERSARIGMIVFVAGWTMMFGALLTAYSLLRKSAPVWPPLGVPHVDRTLPLVSTSVLVASSVTLQLGLVAIREARPAALRGYLLATLALALAFLTLQLAWWRHMVERGLEPSGSLYAAFFYGLTLFHALHVAVGLVGLCSLWPRAARGAFSAREHTAVRNWATYWHFVDVVWIAFFLAVCW